MTPEISFRLRRIFLPYAITTIGCITIYCFFNWALVRERQDLGFSENTINCVTPFLFALAATAIGLYRRFKLFDLDYDEAFTKRTAKKYKLEPLKPEMPNIQSTSWVIFLITVGLIGACSYTMQQYISDSTRKFNHLQSVSEIRSTNETRYYTIKNFYVARNHADTAFRSYTSGKANNTLNFDYYFLIPVYNNIVDTNKNLCAWLGWYYHKSTDNPSDNGIDDSLENDFIRDAHMAYNRETFTNVSYFIRLNESDNEDRFQRMRPAENWEAPVLIMSESSFQEKLNHEAFWFIVALVVTLVSGLGIAILNDLKQGAIPSSSPQ